MRDPQFKIWLKYRKKPGCKALFLIKTETIPMVKGRLSFSKDKP